MSRVIIVHAGQAKTGSSAIQRFCVANRAYLLGAGFLYPPFGMNQQGNHLHLVRAILGQPVPPTHVNSLDGFRDEVRLEPTKTVVISAEYLGNCFQSGRDSAEFLSFLHDQELDVHVVMFIRPEPERINSAYAQQVASFLIDISFEEFARKQVRGIAGRYRNLASLAAPRVATTIIPFNQFVRRMGVVGHFLAAAGVPDGQVVEPERRLNESIGPVAVAVARNMRIKLRERGYELTELRRRALSQVLLSLVGKRKREPAFNGMDVSLYAAITGEVAEAEVEFARVVWQRDWRDMFPIEQLPVSNLVDPNAVDPITRQKYQLLMDELDGEAMAIMANPSKAVERPWDFRPG